MRFLPVTTLALSLLLSNAQFDFDREVAGFFDFGKIPKAFSGFSTLSTLTATPPSIFTAFTTSTASNDQNKVEDTNNLNEKISQVVTDSYLPEFGEIKGNIEEAELSLNDGTNTSDGNNPVKKRSYGVSQGRGGSGGYGGGHGGGYGGGHSAGYQKDQQGAS